MEFRPLRDWLLVLPDEKQEIATDSGIIIHQTIDKLVDSQLQMGKTGSIVACGPGKYIKDRLIPIEVKIGDRISYGQFKYQTVELDGSIYELIQQGDIIGLIED